MGASGVKGAVYPAYNLLYIYIMKWKTPPGKSHRGHRHNHYEFDYAKEGKIEVSIGKEVFEASKGDILLIRPNVFHKGRNDSDEPFQFISVGVEARSRRDLLDCKEDGYLKMSLRPATKLRIEKLLEDIYSEFSAEPLDYELMIQSHLMEFVTVIKREKASLERGAEELPGKPGRESEVVKRARDYIWKNYKKRLDLEEISQNVYVSQYYLCHLFKKEMGCSPIKYVIRTRLDAAKYLLRSTNMTVEEISYEIGYENINYFYRLFKEIEGVTPLQYRKGSK